MAAVRQGARLTATDIFGTKVRGVRRALGRCFERERGMKPGASWSLLFPRQQLSVFTTCPARRQAAVRLEMYSVFRGTSACAFFSGGHMGEREARYAS